MVMEEKSAEKLDKHCTIDPETGQIGFSFESMVAMDALADWVIVARKQARVDLARMTSKLK